MCIEGSHQDVQLTIHSKVINNPTISEVPSGNLSSNNMCSATVMGESSLISYNVNPGFMRGPSSKLLMTRGSLALKWVPW
jgi:hypothetical protein